MKDGCLILGAGGRVGRLLRGAWSVANRDAAVWFHSRSPAAGIDISAPLGRGLAGCVPPSVGLIVVLSGQTSGSEAQLAVNTDYALQGLDLAVATGCPRVVLCSSAAVYRAVPGHPLWRETDPAEPDRPYGRAKRAMEQAAAQWHHATPSPPEVICLRMANVVGADMLADAMRRADEAAPLTLDRFADGRSPRRSYLSPMTLARMIAGLARRPVEGGFRILNAADPGPPLEMAAILHAWSDLGLSVPWQWQPAPPTAIAEMGLDISRLQSVLPQCYDLQDATTARALVEAWLAASGGRP